MSAVLSLPGVGPATLCQVASATAHRPTPLRHVWHHIQPQEAGGQTVTVNLAQLCDSCHYTIHRLMYVMRLKFDGKQLTAEQQGWLDKPPRQAQLAFAVTGYNACVTAGTVDKIPNEG